MPNIVTDGKREDLPLSTDLYANSSLKLYYAGGVQYEKRVQGEPFCRRKRSVPGFLLFRIFLRKFIPKYDNINGRQNT